nr:hypothetical protein Iba_chr09aCG11510 [Ipomoea batatas]
MPAFLADGSIWFTGKEEVQGLSFRLLAVFTIANCRDWRTKLANLLLVFSVSTLGGRVAERCAGFSFRKTAATPEELTAIVHLWCPVFEKRESINLDCWFKPGSLHFWSHFRSFCRVELFAGARQIFLWPRQKLKQVRANDRLGKDCTMAVSSLELLRSGLGESGPQVYDETAVLIGKQRTGKDQWIPSPLGEKRIGVQPKKQRGHRVFGLKVFRNSPCSSILSNSGLNRGLPSQSAGAALYQEPRNSTPSKSG